MDALDIRKSSDVTMVEDIQLSVDRKASNFSAIEDTKEGIPHFQKASPQIQEALEIINAKDVSRTEVLRVWPLPLLIAVLTGAGAQCGLYGGGRECAVEEEIEGVGLALLLLLRHLVRLARSKTTSLP